MPDYQTNIKTHFYKYIQHLQDNICNALEAIDKKSTFVEDKWVRKEGGGGMSRVIENGAVFEKGGVNISKVFGKLPEPIKKNFQTPHSDFFACGISLVIHPKNPFVPTVHANFRYFELLDSSNSVVDSWFGGGQDLTPYYLFEEDATHFHKTCKDVCINHHPEFYEDFKKKCDAYFWNKHRNEARGIGGLFFDYCRPNKTFSIDKWHAFVKDLGDHFLESYIPIVKKRKDIPYNQKQRKWQEIRRGRYVEFNLVYDRGTLFGLQTNGRIESILMSLPPFVQWKYNYLPEKNSEEDKLIAVLQKPKNWTP